MAALKNEQLSIPNGFSYYIPDSKWQPAPFSSIDSITTQLQQHLQGRPDIVAKHGWSLDPSVLRQMVVQYQVALCVRNGWSEYILGGADVQVPFPPTPPRSLIGKARGVAAGVETIFNWIKDGAESVAPELAEQRARICSTCPENKPGGWETFFTVPASNAIRAALDKRKGFNLHTSLDDKLFTCGVCLCPLPLKIHLKLDRILSGMPQDQQDALTPQCWIRNRDQPATPEL
jgi:hypothetical protein